MGNASTGFLGHKDLPRVCIIGAGCSGITTAKRLKDNNIGYDCYEASDDIGGNWYYKNPNGMSACYQSLHIDTSKHRLAFEDYAAPADWPDFPHHSQLHAYFKSYAAHFGVTDTITFNSRVTKAHRRDDGLWQVHLSNGKQILYDALIVCNGHHWNPRLPDPYPGNFTGIQLHAHAYNDPFDPIDMRGKNIVVVGGGNSAMDIASELSQRSISNRLFISMRRGVWVLPKYMNGKPSDKAALPAWLPLDLGRKLAKGALIKAIGRMEDYGLPKPDHDPLTGHPSVSGEFLTRVGCGDITPKPAIARLDGDHVVFTDNSREKVDVIVYATGYKMTFPFFDQEAFQPVNDRLPLWRRMMKPGIDNLFFMGLAQPLPTLVNLAEQQSKLVASYLVGDYALPQKDQMEAQIMADEKIYLGHFYDSPRHTIQIDFAHYVRAGAKELARGKSRADFLALPALPVPPAQRASRRWREPLNRRQQMRPILFATIACFGLMACKPAPPSYTVTDPKTGEKTKISVADKDGDKTITVRTGDGAGTISVATEGEAPKNLPSYVPLYPGAKYMGSFAAASNKSSEGGAVAGGMVTFSTADPSAKVLAFYKDAFTKAGMKEEGSGDMGAMAMLSFTKGNNEQEGAQVMASPAPDGRTQVQVMYSAAP